MKNREKEYKWLRPTFREWTAFLIFILFTAGAIFILPSNRNLAILCLSFFGLGSVVAGITVVRKIRESKFDGTAVQVLGGLDIRPSRFRLLVLSVSLIVLGTNMVIFGDETPIILQIIGGFIFLVGTAMTLLTLLKKLPVGFIRFDTDCFVIGKRGYSISIDWDNIARVEPGDVNSNSAVFIWLKSLDAIKTNPPSSVISALKAIASNDQWLGAHFVLLTGIYGLSGTIVAGALARYKEHPAAREELRRRVLS